MDDYKEDERRAFRRFSFKEPVEFLTKEETASIGSLSSDLSEGGVRIRLFKFVPVQSQITLYISLDPQKTVECEGRVVWIEEVPFSEHYQAGVEFQGLESLFTSRREIRQFFQPQQLI